jgi:hypothetical protein
VHADVAEGDSAEQSVGNGVEEDVAVGVGFKAGFVGDDDAGEDEHAAGRQAVVIPAETRCGIRSCRLLGGLFGEEGLGEFEVGGFGDFDVPVTAGDDVDVDVFEAFDEGGFVGAGEVVGGGLGEGAAEEGKAEDLGGLGEDEAIAGMVVSMRWRETRLTVSTGTTPRMAAPQAAASAMTAAICSRLTKGRTASWTATSSTDSSRVARACSTDSWRESPPTTRRTGFGEGLLVEEGLEAGDVVAAEGDDDLGDDGALGELADRVHEDGGSFEHEELFPTVDRVRLRLHHAGAEAGRRKDNCYFHGQGSLV